MSIDELYCVWSSASCRIISIHVLKANAERRKASLTEIAITSKTNPLKFSFHVATLRTALMWFRAEVELKVKKEQEKITIYD